MSAAPPPVDDPARLLDRRGLLLAAVTGAAATATAGTALIQHTAGSAAAAVSGGGAAAAPAPATAALTARSGTGSTATAKAPATLALPKNLSPTLLISRATYGRTATLDRQVHELTPSRWLAAQLRPSTIADPAGAAILKRYPRLGWSAAKVRSSLKDGSWAVMFDLAAAHLARAAWSSRQLNEVMVDFWSNHLNIACPSSDVWDTRHRYDADVIRKNALGSFEKMLLASAFHPSMLRYLNNAESTKQSPNENYARELLELHTVGIGGGYTEKDIKRSALLLTGWTVERGTARFRADRHHVGSVTVLGHKITNSTAAGGRAAQERYLKYLAHHPRTARNIAHKLAVRFVSDDPPAALVKRITATYLTSKTAIVPVLRVLFASPEFAASKGLKLRRPLEATVASIRVLGITPGKDSAGLMDLVWMTGGMNHAPLAWPQPDGYSDRAADWQSPSAALAQFNAAASLVHGWWPSKLSIPGPKKLLTSPPRTRDGVIAAVSQRVLGRAPTTKERAAARTLMAGTKLPSSFSQGSWEQQETIALTATLLLSSPAHLTR
jgi:uncharacterized protein (DUF1800 family)